MQKFNYTTRKHPRTLHEAFPVTAYQWWFPPEKKPATLVDWLLRIMACVLIYSAASLWING